MPPKTRGLQWNEANTPNFLKALKQGAGFAEDDVKTKFGRGEGPGSEDEEGEGEDSEGGPARQGSNSSAGRVKDRAPAPDEMPQMVMGTGVSAAEAESWIGGSAGIEALVDESRARTLRDKALHAAAHRPPVKSLDDLIARMKEDKANGKARVTYRDADLGGATAAPGKIAFRKPATRNPANSGKPPATTVSSSSASSGPRSSAGAAADKRKATSSHEGPALGSPKKPKKARKASGPALLSFDPDG